LGAAWSGRSIKRLNHRVWPDTSMITKAIFGDHVGKTIDAEQVEILENAKVTLRRRDWSVTHVLCWKFFHVLTKVNTLLGSTEQ